MLFFSWSCVYAQDEYKLSINANTQTVYVNSTVNITISSYNVMGSYSLVSSNTNVLKGGDQNTIDSGDSFSKTYTFTALSEGTVVVTLSPRYAGALRVYSDESEVQSRSITIKVIKKTTTPSVDVNKVYDKNNYLKSLSIEGYDFSPKFSKETLEYEVELDPGTELVNISASLESRKAKVKGVGEIKVTEGLNTIKVVVTAENGNERTYKIIAKVDEKDPINIKINGQKYTIIKKRELLTTKNGYEETSVSINSFEIPALYNEVTKVTLVGVKDKEGNIILVSYDSKTGDYKTYKEFSFDLMNLYIHEKKDSEYKVKKIRINSSDVIGYELEGVKDYYLLYATNTVTGYEGYYLYDSEENSVQRYDTTLLDNISNTKDKFLSIVLVLSCVCFLTMLFLLIEVNRDNKRNLEE